MTEIEIYIETLKAVHNDYILELRSLEETLCDAYNKGYIPLNGADKEACVSVIHATINIAIMSLKMRMDARMYEIENKS